MRLSSESTGTGEAAIREWGIAAGWRPMPGEGAGGAEPWALGAECAPSALDQIRLETARLILREFAEDDATAVQVWAGDPAVVRYEAWGPNTLDQTREFLRGAAANRRERPRDTFDLGIMLKDARLLIGVGRICIEGREHGEGSIGYALRRDAWDHGYATEAACALLELALAGLRLTNVCARCQVENARSLRVLEKLGMRCEARFRHEGRRREALRNSYVYVRRKQDREDRDGHHPSELCRSCAGRQGVAP